ncbi:hypothetical protein CR513_15645, partial [Mucuna pruriens]
MVEILARKLREMIRNLVSHYPSNFVPNHHSSNNIIITHEVFHSMRNKKRRVRWMTTKIDLEKTYGKLRYRYVPKILDLIFHCIFSSKMRILWNYEMLEEFKPSRVEHESSRALLGMFFNFFCMTNDKTKIFFSRNPLEVKDKIGQTLGF